MPADLDLLYSEARAQLDNQLDAFDALDGKIGGTVALAAAEAAIVTAAISFAHPASESSIMLGAAAVAVVISLVVFACTVVLSFETLRMAPLETGPELEDLAQRYADGEAAELVKARAISTLHDDFLNNDREYYQPKKRVLARIRTSLAIETVAIFLALILLAIPSLFQSSGSGEGTRPAHSLATSSPLAHAALNLHDQRRSASAVQVVPAGASFQSP